MYLRCKRLKLIAILTFSIVMGLSTLSSFAMMKSPIPVDVNQVEKESAPNADSSAPTPENNIDSIYGNDLQMQQYEAKRKLDIAKREKLILKESFKLKLASLSQSVSILRNDLLKESDEKIKENIKMGIQYFEDDFGFSTYQYHILKKECKKDINKAQKRINELKNKHEVHHDKVQK